VILKRQGLGRLGRVGLEQPTRYERSRPGELVHIDVKKLGRIRGVGHRISGNRASQAKTRINGRRTGIAGWEYVHVAVDVDRPRFRGQRVVRQLLVVLLLSSSRTRPETCS